MVKCTMGICCVCFGVLLMILSAALMALGVKMFLEKDEQISNTQSKYARGTKTPLYYEFFIFSTVTGLVGILACVFGYRCIRTDYEPDIIRRVRRRYEKERPQRLAEGAREMQHVYLRRSPPPPEEYERL